MYAAAAALSPGFWAPRDTNARVGVFDRWPSDSYSFRVDDGGTSLRRPTSVRRTTGWHRFYGTLVGRSALVPYFSQVWIGNGWEAEQDETFVDDFELSCSPAFG